MPQYEHSKLRFFMLVPKTSVSLSAPVDVIVPLLVVGAAGSGETIIVFELLHIIPEFEDDDDVIVEPKPPLLLLLPPPPPKPLLRATRLFARAVMRLLRSSRSSDFNGDTCNGNEREERRSSL